MDYRFCNLNIDSETVKDVKVSERPGTLPAVAVTLPSAGGSSKVGLPQNDASQTICSSATELVAVNRYCTSEIT